MSAQRRAGNAVKRATAELAARDPVVAALAERHGLPTLASRRNPESHFDSLSGSIVYQQLSGKAAGTIHGRFKALFDGPPTPEAVLATPLETLRSVGLSQNKALSILDLAAKVADGSVPLDDVESLDDEELIQRVSSVRGIGRWTAEMFLIFQLRRLDVWPVDDLGVRKGFARAWGLPEMPTPKQLGPMGDPFRPYRTIVAWYCWRAADTTF